MKTLIFNHALSFYDSYKVETIIFLTTLVVSGFFILKNYIQRKYDETFFHANEYYYKDLNTQKIIFPVVKKYKNKIVLKRLINKTIEKIRNDKDLFESHFNIRILNIEKYKKDIVFHLET